MRLRARAYLLGLLPALLVAVVLGAYLSYTRLHDLDTTLRQRGDDLTRYVAQGAEFAVVSGNREALEQLLEWARREGELRHASIYGTDGRAIAQAGIAPSSLRLPLRPGNEEWGDSLVVTSPVLLPVLEINDPFLPDPEYAQTRPTPIAWVRLTFSRDHYRDQARVMLVTSLIIVTLGLLFAGLLVRKLALVGIQPLMEAIAAVRQIAGGDFRVRLPITARSELQELQRGVNQMSDALLSYQEDMQGQVRLATAELAAQKESAEQADLAKSRFLAAASHDLRQPLHAIGLFVEALKPQLTGRNAAILLGKIESSVVSLESLFNAILDVTRLDAGAVVPQATSVDLHHLITRLGLEFQPEAEQRGLRLSTRVRPGLHCITDATLLERILRNLLSNALRYTRTGGVLLSVRPRGDGRALLQVWDTGMGIPLADQSRVFEEFFQVDNPHRDRDRGLGLGLSIVKRLADLLGYQLAVRSRPGQGSVFCLNLSLAPSATPMQAAEIEPPPGMARLRGKVLVVDDDTIGRDALRGLLESWGLETLAASGSAEALAHLRTVPDAVLSDYRLRGETGLEVVTALERGFPGQTFATILITADTSGATTRAIRERGLRLLHKPLRPAKLRALLSQLLRERSGPPDP